MKIEEDEGGGGSRIREGWYIRNKMERVLN